MNFFKRRKLRKEVKAALHDARMTLNMNRDLYDADTIADFDSTINTLRAASAPQDIVSSINAIYANTDKHRPKCASPGMRELVETIVVAFGVAMAFRAYFFQPFKIPTGSMQPTLYGMHSVAATPDNPPDLFDKVLPLKPVKWLFTGVWYKEVVAKKDGAASISQDGIKAPGRVIINLAGKTHKIPQDAFDRGEIKLPTPRRAGMADNPNENVRHMLTGYVSKGDKLWAGYSTSGDQLFVNRMAWNFFPPKRDNVSVFATSLQKIFFTKQAALDEFANNPMAVVTKVPNTPIYMVDTPITGLMAGQHYIKRLVGLPNETISIQHPRVLVNGEPVTGLFGMDRVAAMGETTSGPSASYAGYRNTGDPDMPFTNMRTLLSTPEDSVLLGDEYLPMGDNTLNSFDGRYWGPVPRPNMLGPGAFVYWPISPRWGKIR